MNSDAPKLQGLSAADLRRHGVPTPEQQRLRVRAVTCASQTCADLLHPGGVRMSPLGAGWGSDLDLHVRRIPAPDRLRRHGWIRIDELLRRIGSRAGYRWVIVDNGDLLATADFHVSSPPSQLHALITRCWQRGEVRAREMLELRELRCRGVVVPTSDPVVAAAAVLEASLQESGLDTDTTDAAPPMRLQARRLRRRVGALRERLRPTFVVALSGVDGAGKSTLARLLEENLQRLDIPTTVVWSRPGMNMGPALGWAAAFAKRALQLDPSPGVRLAAQGDAAAIRSRRGLLGWLWCVAVTLAFVCRVRRAQSRARGVVIYDRHLLDAVATLDFAYEGAGGRAARALVTYCLPRARVTFYLDVPMAIAVARKPGDTIGEVAVARQLESYAAHRGDISRLYVLDGTRRIEDLSRDALEVILSGGPPTVGPNRIPA